MPKRTTKRRNSDFDVKIFYFPETKGFHGKTKRFISLFGDVVNRLAGAFRRKLTKNRRPSGEK